jgi:hypothetical protein
MELIKKTKVIEEVGKQLRLFRALHNNEDPVKIVLTEEEWDRMVDEVHMEDTAKLKKLKYKEYWKEENKKYRPANLFGIPVEPVPPPVIPQVSKRSRTIDLKF